MQQPSLIIDSNVLISAFDEDDPNHNDAIDILRKRINDARPKSIFISQFILSELIAHITRKQKTRECSKDQRKKYLQNLAKFTQSQKVRIIYASESEVATALHFVEKYADIPASLADWLSMVLSVRHQIPVIQTHDRDFREIVKIEPKFKDVKIWSRLE